MVVTYLMEKWVVQEEMLVILQEGRTHSKSLFLLWTLTLCFSICRKLLIGCGMLYKIRANGISGKLLSLIKVSYKTVCRELS